MNEVIWSFTALAQLRAIRAYIAQFNPQAAENMARRLLAPGNSLRNFPYRGRPVPGTPMRELTVINPYIIRYEVSRNEAHPANPTRVTLAHGSLSGPIVRCSPVSRPKNRSAPAPVARGSVR